MILRDYQKKAVERILWSMKLEGNDLLSLPTGSGKSLIIAEIARQIGKEVLIFQPSKEILEQNLEKLSKVVPKEEISVYSASMGEKEISKYTLATIGSVYSKPELFKHIGLVIIDEAHLVNFKDSSTMFSKFLKGIGNPKVIGMTATIYRNEMAYHLKYGTWQDGEIISRSTLKLINRTNPRFWHRLVYKIDPYELIERGFLSKLQYESRTFIKQEDIKLNKSESDFDLEDYQQKLKSKEQQIVDAVKECTQIYNSTLVFCSSVHQAEKMSFLTENSASVSAKTPPKERAEIIDKFKNGEIKVVFNVGVLTTGFDHPSLDCIILLRPTRSLSLYYQMVGRGIRISEGKDFCKLIDYSDTVNNLGRIESFKLEKDWDNKWNLKTDTGYWHNRILYEMKITKDKNKS